MNKSMFSSEAARKGLAKVSSRNLSMKDTELRGFLAVLTLLPLFVFPEARANENLDYWKKVGLELHSARRCRFSDYSQQLGKMHKENLSKLRGSNRRAYLSGYESALEAPLLCDETLLNGVLSNFEATNSQSNEATGSAMLSGEQNPTNSVNSQLLTDYTSQSICHLAIGVDGNWDNDPKVKKFVDEAKRRGLGCGTDSLKSNHPKSETIIADGGKIPHFDDYRRITARIGGIIQDSLIGVNYLSTPQGPKSQGLVIFGNEACKTEVKPNSRDNFTLECPSGYQASGQIKPEGSGKGESGEGKDNLGNDVQYRLHPSLGPNAVSREDYVSLWNQRIGKDARDLSTLADNEALRAELAALKAQKEQQHATIEADNQVPLIDIFSADTTGKQGLIKGYVADNTGIAEVTVDGNVVPVTSSGSFEYRTFVPPNGINVQIQATDIAGLTSVMSVSLERSASTATASITFDRLNPLGKRVKPNRDALALIVGVADYENTPAKAIFADSDALMFRDYASEKLGIPENRIKTLVDDGADERQLLLSVKNWLSRAVKQNKSDVFVFFAGHGLASDDGEKMYLLPYDGAPELLDDTAIARERLFSDIAAANPRSVTVFLDTCYSGTTRGPDMLIASRPIAIRANESSIPEGFTVMTAAAGDQTAKPLEEAKHGMFSYFLMKGMEGDADANQDNQITAGELHVYVQRNVIQQSSGSQTPELQGNADRVLVRFQ